jgi:hypothetical protein
MKAIKAAMLGVAMVFAAAGAARAETLEVKIPFAFTVGARQLPAGVYRIQRSSETAPSILRIEGEHGNRTEMFIQTTPMQRVNSVREPALIFVPGETANRLTAIWGSSDAGYEVSGSRHHSKLVGQIVVPGLRVS